jgi:hypothetical protein
VARAVDLFRQRPMHWLTFGRSFVLSLGNAHDLEGFTRNLSALAVNQAGINASATCAHEYPPAKRR